MLRPPSFRDVIVTSILSVLSVSGWSWGADPPHFELQEADDGITVNLNGHLFTRYIKRSGTKPILWPLIGPTGAAVTRQFPMQEAAAHEKADHPHHRSLWFTHGDVDGLSYWHEPESGKFGTIEHQRFLEITSGERGAIVSENHWVDDRQNVVCHDLRTIHFAATAETRQIDFDVKLTPAGDKPVRFGDTKEGSFGIRVAGTMKVDENLGGKIVNREGITNADAWGKRSAWVDYHGPVRENGPTVGIAILHHPTSFRFPTYWHVRTYGLFAANPFGVHNFENDSQQDGSYVLEPGDALRFRYRVILHLGDQQAANIEQQFVAYESEP